jgi:hypothetical protein
MDHLSAYLRDATASPFDWDGRNCMLWVADWVQLKTGRDPARDWRRGVFDPARIDVAAISAEAMASFPGTQTPARGDVGIVLTGPDGKPTAAICTGRRWAALAPQGVAVSAWPCIMAWKI